MSYYTYEDVRRAVRRATAAKDAEIQMLRAQVEWLEKIVYGQVILQPPPPIILQVSAEEAEQVKKMTSKASTDDQT